MGRSEALKRAQRMYYENHKAEIREYKRKGNRERYHKNEESRKALLIKLKDKRYADADTTLRYIRRLFE
jgi:hypothetical protein